MNRIMKPTRLGFAAALLALLLAPLAFGAQSAQAQVGPDVAQYYGAGLMAGDVVTASIGGATCAETTANADGQWILQISMSDCDGAAEDGATVHFAVNGAMAEQMGMWSAGGAPSDPAGIMLTVPAMPEPTPEPPASPEPPAPPETGNAGLAAASSADSTPWAALGLGLAALALAAAGARRLTARNRAS